MKRAAVVGIGKMGIVHASLLNALPDVELVAIVDRDKKLKNRARGIGVKASFYTDLEEMLEKGKLDAVFLCLPSYINYPLAKACAEKGINIFVEKPLANNVENAKEMAELAQRTGIKSAVGYMVAFIPTFEKAEELLKEETIGRVQKVEAKACLSAVFSRQDSWFCKKDKAGGGAVSAIGSHLIYLVERLLLPVKNINSVELRYPTGNEVEDEGRIELELEGEIPVLMDVSWSIPGYKNIWLMLKFWGEKGNLKVTNQELEIDAREHQMIHISELQRKAKFYLGGYGYCEEDEDFISCIGSGNEPKVTWQDGLRVQGVLSNIYERAEAK